MLEAPDFMLESTEQRSREAEKQRSREAEKQRSREAEKQRSREAESMNPIAVSAQLYSLAS
jgi:hypothetical protein